MNWPTKMLPRKAAESIVEQTSARTAEVTMYRTERAGPRQSVRTGARMRSAA